MEWQKLVLFVHCFVSTCLVNQPTTVLELGLSVALFELNRTIWQEFFCIFVIYFTRGNFFGNHLQGVLALCEFHYCEFRYCGFSKLSRYILLLRFYIYFADAIFWLMRFYVLFILLLQSLAKICLMRFLANANFSRSQKSH